MKWWKKALVGSVIWTVLVAVGVVFMLQRIKHEATSPEHREAWEDKMAETAGLFFGGGQVVIWALAWHRERRKS